MSVFCIQFCHYMWSTVYLRLIINKYKYLCTLYIYTALDNKHYYIQQIFSIIHNFPVTIFIQKLNNTKKWV